MIFSKKTKAIIPNLEKPKKVWKLSGSQKYPNLYAHENNLARIRGKLKEVKGKLPSLVNLKRIDFEGELKKGNYIFRYKKDRDTLHIWFIEKLNENSGLKTDLKDLFFKIKSTASQLECKSIDCGTWIFALNPRLKNRLGFKVVDNILEKQFLEFIKEKKVKAIQYSRGAVIGVLGNGKTTHLIGMPAYPEYYLELKK